MIELPPVAEAAIAAVLVISVLRAFFGRPPAEADVVAAAGWLFAGVLLLVTVAVAGNREWSWELLTAGAVEAACVAGWWLRRRDDGGEPADEPAEPPLDWDEFDRLRREWSGGPRTRPPELV